MMSLESWPPISSTVRTSGSLPQGRHGVGGDLVLDEVRAEHEAGQVPPAPGRADPAHRQVRQAGRQHPQGGLERVDRISLGAQVELVQERPALVQDDHVRADRPHIDPEETRLHPSTPYRELKPQS